MPLTRIERSDDLVLLWRIEAPRTRVWRCLTEPGLLDQWMGVLVDGAVEAESAFVVDHGDDYHCRSTVTGFVEPSRLEFTWHFPDEPVSVVRLSLDGHHDTTDLRLDHGDLGDLVEPYRPGWCAHLSYLEAAALETPLPPSMFWRLHGTMAQLGSP